MRKRITRNGLTVNAIAGSGVVMLGFDLSDAARPGCLGFAIERTHHSTGEVEWLRGAKSFEATEADGGEGDGFRSNLHPFQSFQWADYSARDNAEYTFKVVPLYGTPTNIKRGRSVSVKIRTEPAIGAPHSVFFNRGSAASQAYARRFNNRYPDDPANGPGYNAAYRWLSRGLHESLMNFLARAVDATYTIRAAIYEFEWPDTLAAFREAHLRGADVRIIYDAIKAPSPPPQRNLTVRIREAVAAAGIKGLCIERTQGTIMHNKFVVLLRNGQPVAVWTGSTNQTENGIFGHSNVGHIVGDPAIARAYLDYWDELRKNTSAIRGWVETNNPLPQFPPADGTSVVFSPRQGLAGLDLFAEIASNARRGLFMTFAFGMHKKFQDAFERERGVPAAGRRVLNFALMEKEGNGSGLAKGKQDIQRIRNLSNVVVAVGNRIRNNDLERWVAEIAKPTRHAGVLWIHTKFMIVDPLGRNPVVVTGSANFSEAGIRSNHENMLVIKGDARTADIYLGEFMRLHSHYAFREAVAKDFNNNQVWRPHHLVPDDTWQNAGYFTPGAARYLRRRYFAGRQTDVN